MGRAILQLTRRVLISSVCQADFFDLSVYQRKMLQQSRVGRCYHGDVQCRHACVATAIRGAGK